MGTRFRYTTLLFTILLTDGGCTKKTEQTMFFGQVEMSEINLASRLSSRVNSISVKRGEQVEGGQVLLVMDDDIIDVRRQRAQAGIEAASSQRQMLERAVRDEEIIQLKSVKEAAKQQQRFADQTLQRMKILLAEGAISQQQYDEVELKSYAAGAQYRATQAAYRLGMKGAREEQRRAAEAQVVQAQTGLAELSAFEKDLLLIAPKNAEVVDIHVRPGELIPQGYPMITLLDPEDIWLSFHIRENDLQNFRLGETYRIRIPALGNQVINAQLAYLSPLPAFANYTVSLDRGRIELKTFELRLVPNSKLDGLRPGMSASLLAGAL